MKRPSLKLVREAEPPRLGDTGSTVSVSLERRQRLARLGAIYQQLVRIEGAGWSMAGLQDRADKLWAEVQSL